jgi:hypothetical protein
MVSVGVTMTLHITLSCFFITSLFYTSLVLSTPQDYYWREYNGTIPDDAIIGGKSLAQNVYIGQAYVKKEGLIVVKIIPGVKEVLATIKGVRKIDQYIKVSRIMCESLRFVKTD